MKQSTKDYLIYTNTKKEKLAMKRLTCEMCGSTDLIKQDGVFVCQSCGCKYSIEEARKMMVEGPVDVSGSVVKVDQSEKLKNLLSLARRARIEKNSEDAKKKLRACFDRESEQLVSDVGNL